MFKKLLFVFVMFLIAGPLIMFCIPEGVWRDRFATVWGKSYMVVFYLGCVTGVIMFAIILLKKLFE